MVTIRIPGFDTGCILVDLPGVGDANAARDGIAQEVSIYGRKYLVMLSEYRF